MQEFTSPENHCFYCKKCYSFIQRGFIAKKITHMLTKTPWVDYYKKARSYTFIALALFFVLPILLFIPSFHGNVYAQSTTSLDPIDELKASHAGDFILACAELLGYKGHPTSGNLKNGDFINTRLSARHMVAVGFILSDTGAWNCNEPNDLAKAIDMLGTDGERLLATGNNPLYVLDGAEQDTKYKLAEGDNNEASYRRLSSSVKAQKERIGAGDDISEAAKYFSFLSTFKKTCGKDGVSPNGSTVKIVDSSSGEIKEEKYVLHYESPQEALDSGNVAYTIFGSAVDATVDVGLNSSCSQLVTFMNAFAEQASSAVKDGSIDAESNDSSTGNAPSCEGETGVMGWVMCPVVKMIEVATNWIDTQIQALLEVDSNYYSGDMKLVFANIRNVAYVILVPIVLVMVIGTAMGFDFVSAYTVKRALPRLLIAVIFIALSYDICVFIIQFVNELGSAVNGIISAPFAGAGGFNLSSMFAGETLTGILTGAAGAVGLVLIVWLFGGTILLFAAIAFLVLMLRQMFIVVLLLAAPLAILAWIFPGNDKLWKLWWGSFSKLLLMYPLIMALIAVGRVFAWTIHNGDDAGIQGAVWQPLMTLIAYTIPYAFIPFTFKFAGGMFATVAGMANDRSKGLFDRQRNRRQRIYKDTGERAKASNLIKGAPVGSRRERWNNRIGYLANQKAGGLTLNRERRRARITGADDAHTLAAGMKHAEEDSTARQVFASDDIMMAGLEGGGDFNRTRNYLASRINDDGSRMYTDQQAAIMAEQALGQQKVMGRRAFELTALSKLPATGTAFTGEDGVQDWLERIDRVSEGNGSLKASLVAAGKSGFRSAQRYEISEASFGTIMQESQNMGQATTDAEREAIVNRIISNAYESGGPAAVVGSRNAGVAETFARVINANLEAAEAAHAANPTEETRTEVLRQKAAIGAIHESLGQAKQSVSRVIGREVMGADAGTIQVEVDTGLVDPNGVPIMRTETQTINRVQEMQQLASDPVWQQFKREYRDAIDQATAQQQTQQAQMGGVNPGGPTPGQGFGPPNP